MIKISVIKNVIKKVLLILFLLSGVCFAQDAFCPQPPYPVSNGFSQIISKITGANLASTSILEKAITSNLEKSLGGKFKAEVTPYGILDLAQGKLKKFAFEGESLFFDGINASNFKAASVCEYNQIVYKNSNLYFGENMVVAFEMNLSQTDIKNIIKNSQYSDALNSLNSYPLFKLSIADASIIPNGLRFVVKVASIFMNRNPQFTFDTNLTVQNGQIVFGKITPSGFGQTISMQPILNILNNFNPLVFKIDILGNKNSLLKVNNVKIDDGNKSGGGKILVDGLVYISQNYTK